MGWLLRFSGKSIAACACTGGFNNVVARPSKRTVTDFYTNGLQKDEA
jgi:hypothetical protein